MGVKADLNVSARRNARDTGTMAPSRGQMNTQHARSPTLAVPRLSVVLTISVTDINQVSFETYYRTQLVSVVLNNPYFVANVSSEY